jgi:hypothetical protein
MTSKNEVPVEEMAPDERAAASLDEIQVILDKYRCRLVVWEEREDGIVVNQGVRIKAV